MVKIYNFVTKWLLLTIICLTLVPGLVFADVGNEIEYQLQPIGDVYGQQGNIGEVSLAQTIAEIIRAVLMLLGIIFLALIVYAGFVWMTSAGNEEKITRAKKTIVAAVIGVAIIIFAYAITTFVITSISEAVD